MIDKYIFSKRLTELRNKCGLSQSKLADMLYISGQAVSKWENASSLPDIELLLPLSQILGVSIDYLLGSEKDEFKNDSDTICEAIRGYDVSDKDINILSAMSSIMPREYLYKTAKYMEKDLLEYKLTLELTSNLGGERNSYRQDISLNAYDKNSILPFSKHISALTLQAINKNCNPVQEIIGLMKCPICGGDFEYFKTSEEFISCKEHKFYINDGVVDFKTLEIHGYTWSSWIRRYDDYKKNNVPKIDESIKDHIRPFSESKSWLADMLYTLKQSKPSVILDIGSGMGFFAAQLIQYIDWECVLVLTDLSHRILKYDKRYFDETSINPNVKVVYLACDVCNLPFKDNSLECITSCGGYDCVMTDFTNSMSESHRALSENGKIVFSIGLIGNREDENVQKWLDLIKADTDPDMLQFYSQIYDIKEWHEIIKNLGFAKHTLIQTETEIPVPDTDVFPYDCMIGRWMGSANIVAEKL
ncbi:MAG: hypothetical protein K0S47_4226 [Herbinix sp.]|jgi:transcriptional regulator with XRE-family HTH domain/ubiquinone/menaquinone biosynthesis C-methylase UbiE|nr:hypothetical protein [Herbinix sp.]